jgi:hypothetical protein
MNEFNPRCSLALLLNGQTYYITVNEGDGLFAVLIDHGSSLTEPTVCQIEKH